MRYERSGQPQFGSPIPVNPSTPAPAVRRDRIASRSDPVVQGTVVGGDQRPQAGARLLFISNDASHTRVQSQADGSGNFEVKLPAGSWLLYTYDAQGRTDYKQKLTVQDEQTTLVKLVNLTR
jgi:hypothetical protein